MKFLPALLLFLSLPAFAAALSIDSMVSLLVTLVIVGLIFWLIWWFLGYIGLPEPFDKIARVIVGLCAVLFLLSLLLGLTGHSFISLR